MKTRRKRLQKAIITARQNRDACADNEQTKRIYWNKQIIRAVDNLRKYDG